MLTWKFGKPLLQRAVDEEQGHGLEREHGAAIEHGSVSRAAKTGIAAVDAASMAREMVCEMAAAMDVSAPPRVPSHHPADAKLNSPVRVSLAISASMISFSASRAALSTLSMRVASTSNRFS